MRIVLATLLFLHGLVHVVGFIGPFQIFRRVPYQISLLGEPLDPGELGAKLLGLLWLLVAGAFAVAAAAASANVAWWPTYTAVVTTSSLVLCIVGWPGSKIGVPVNLIVLMAMLVATRPGLWGYLIGWLRVLS
jgi:hypothetical protein